jgi:hypothetical protein
MGFALRGHRVCSTPSKRCGEDLGALVALLTSGPSKHSVSKGRVRQLHIVEHSRESVCKCRIDTRSYPTL